MKTKCVHRRVNNSLKVQRVLYGRTLSVAIHFTKTTTHFCSVFSEECNNKGYDRFCFRRYMTLYSLLSDKYVVDICIVISYETIYMSVYGVV